MKRRDAALLGAFLVLVWAGLSAVLLAKGGIYIAKHDGDTVHLFDIVLREAAGEWPHLDFMTPLGYLATAPIALFVALGFPAGMAFLLGQVLVGAILLLPVWWVGVSRLQTAWAMVLGAICTVLALAMVHGEPEPLLSVSMHYNRWAWALAFPAIATAILEPVNRRSQVADGLVIGLAVMALALIKVTYVVAFAPTILVALLLRRAWMTIGVACLAALAGVAVLTLAAGPAFWPAYLEDLLTVATSESRRRPGHKLTGVVAAPAYLGGSFAAVISVILLRQAGRAREGLLLLLLLPGFFYVTYQNYGNDPQWLYLLAVLLFALRPPAGTVNAMGWDMRQAVSLAGASVLMLGLPSALNLTFSPFRHLAVDVSNHDALSETLADVFVKAETTVQAWGMVELPFAREEAPDGGEDAEIAILNGEILPNCEVLSGLRVAYAGIAKDLEAAGYRGAAIYKADLLSGLWLFGDFKRLKGAAPWLYDGLPGIDAADYVVVPLCPVYSKSRAGVLKHLAEEGYGLTEVRRTPNYVLLELQAPAAAPSER
ncbi:hypothetical protein [Tropicimonas isoalkanivorans]|uniref:DUF2029 domain-containing protein n=1 Tax=Tropicimonas isoalkanivorans TaxID=441112 RepID=A0A1I1IWI1_9RHOB|nr:hypothetical protein [Tropicimonas isoalkanivorans]SFC38063.1 hypothetical protein SAMN04488094_104168 [Tropicimonas isoalkanivorans]